MVKTVDINGSPTDINVEFPNYSKQQGTFTGALTTKMTEIPDSFSFQYKVSIKLNNVEMFISSGCEAHGICSGLIFNYYANVEFSEKNSKQICSLLNIPYLDDEGFAMKYRAINMQLLWTRSLQDGSLSRLDMKRWKGTHQERVRCFGDIEIQPSSTFMVVKLDNVSTVQDLNNPC